MSARAQVGDLFRNLTDGIVMIVINVKMLQIRQTRKSMMKIDAFGVYKCFATERVLVFPESGDTLVAR